MKLLNWGSMNIDHVYKVEKFLQPGETLAAKDYAIFPGGKGLNQSIALARAGSQVFHAGATGSGGGLLMDCLAQSAVDTCYVKKVPINQGHAIIQVNPKGENCILIYAGSNQAVDREHIDQVLTDFDGDTLVILQNEISNIDYIIERASAKGMSIALNPSPMDEAMKKIDYGKITWLLVNEIEGQEIAGEREPEKILDSLAAKFPRLNVVLTLGKNGCVCASGGKRIHQATFPVNVRDTTAAGDTFTGYFLASVANGTEIGKALKIATAAASISVSREGASVSIPEAKEVEDFLRRQG
jgi:ribokinase